MRPARRVFPLMFSMFSLLAHGAACVAATGKASDLEQALTVSQNRWPSTIIPVCWENPLPNHEHDRARVREVVERNWEAHAAVDLVGWLPCSSQSRGIRIRVSDEVPHSRAQGRSLDGLSDGIVLNFDLQGWPCSPRESCIETIAVHEFGHALGLGHGPARRQEVLNCAEQHPGSDAVLDSVRADTSSVMNYCDSHWSGDGVTSEGDIEALRLMYGPPVQSLIGLSDREDGSKLDIACTIPLDIQPPTVDLARDDQVFNHVVDCSHSKAHSAYLRNLPAGQVLRLYGSSRDRYSDDWVEVVLLRDVDEKALGSLERSFRDSDVRVSHHHSDGLAGQVARLEIGREQAGPVVDLYPRNEAEGRLVCSVLAKYVPPASNGLRSGAAECADDRAASLVLHGFRAGQVIRLYDDEHGDRNRDWTEIIVKRDLPRKQIDSLQRAFEDADVRVAYFRKDGLDGRLSRLEIDERSLALGGLWAGISNGKRFQSFELGKWRNTRQMKVLTGDFDGDGRTDVAKFDVPASGTARLPVWVGLSRGLTLQASRWEVWRNDPRMKVLSGDFNGDGRTDVLKFDVPGSGSSRQPVWVGLSDGARFNTGRWDAWRTSERMKVLTGDFDGDGRTDVMKADVPASGTAKQAVWVGLSVGSAFRTTRWGLWHTNTLTRTLAGDFDGDGVTDVMKVNLPSAGTSPVVAWVGISDGARFDTTAWGRFEADKHTRLVVGDFNGDGKSDVLKVDVPVARQAKTSLWVGLSDGFGFYPRRWGGWEANPQMRVLVGDFNRDGLSDVMKFDVPPSGESGMGTLWVGLSDGNSFQTSPWATWLANEHMQVFGGDFNSDGMTDVMKFDVPSPGGR